MAFSPDGGRLVTGSHHEGVKVWDAHTGAELLALKGHKLAILSVCFSPNGTRVAAGGSDKSVRMWDSRTGRVLATLTGHTAFVRGVAFSPDGKFLASGGDDGTVWLWEGETGRQVFPLRGGGGAVGGVAFSPDGKFLAAASADTAVRVWDLETRRVFSTHLRAATGSGLAFSPDGRHLAAGGTGGVVRVWDAFTAQELFTFRGHADVVWGVAFHPDGSRLASAGNDKTVRLWDLRSPQSTVTIRGHVPSRTAFNPDGTRLAGGGKGHTVKVWDADTGREVLSLVGHTQPVTVTAFSPDGTRLASAANAPHFNPMNPLQFNAAHGEVKLWDSHGGKNLLTIAGHAEPVEDVAFSPDGSRLATASWDKTVKLWDARTGQLLATIDGHVSQVTSVAFSPDGLRLASGGSSQPVKVWDAATGREIRLPRGDLAPASRVAFSGDGTRLVGASYNRVLVWDAATGAVIHTLSGHQYGVTGAAFTPEGDRIASGGADGKLNLWDAVSGQEVLSLSERDRVTVESVCVSRDGRRIACGRGETVQVRDAGPVPTPVFLRAPWDLLGAAFSPDGRRLSAWGIEGNDIAWDTATWEEIPAEPAADRGPAFNALSPDGRLRAIVNWAAARRPTVVVVEARPSDQQRRDWAEFLRSDPDWHWAEAEEARKSGRWFAVAFHLDKVPGDPRLDPVRWEAWSRLGRWEALAVELRRRWEAAPDDRDLPFWVAVAQLSAGDEKGYAETCRRLLEAPAGDRGAAARACALRPESLADLNQLRTLAAEAPQLWRARLLCRLGNNEEAAALLADLRPEPLTLLHRSLAECGRGRFAEGRRALDLALKTDTASWVWHARQEFALLRQQAESQAKPPRMLPLP